MAMNYFISKLDYQPEKLSPALVKLVIVLMTVDFKEVVKIVVSFPGFAAFRPCSLALVAAPLIAIILAFL